MTFEDSGDDDSVDGYCVNIITIIIIIIVIIIIIINIIIIISPYTEYEFGVLAVNNVGRGKKSIAALATTGETSRMMMITHAMQ